MNVTWILEPGIFTQYHQRLIDEIESQGHDVRTIPTFYTSLEWGDTDRFYDDFAPKGSCVVCHASLQFTTLVAEDEVWSPGVYGISEAIDCSHYFPHYADCLLNSDYELLLFDELAERADSLVSSFGIDDRVFIRPDSGGKSFTGRLFTRAELTAQKLRSLGMSPKAKVVVSQPKALRREWRFIIVDHKVIAASMYKESGSLQLSADVPARALDFATSVASGEFQPDRVWVLDACETSQGDILVVEINSFSSSNWYACNLKDIVTAVSQVALEDWSRCK